MAFSDRTAQSRILAGRHRLIEEAQLGDSIMAYDYEAARRYWRSAKGKVARKRYRDSIKGQRALRRERIRQRLKRLARVQSEKRDVIAALQRELKQLEARL